uniref:Putative secreted protein n=1 Tax=Ixodes ricinus TaxID=34613 RepID=A0A6B0URN1_IXORI
MSRRSGVRSLLVTTVYACRASTCWPDGSLSNRQTRESWHRCDCHPRKILVVRSITSCKSVTTLPRIYCAGKRSYTYKTTPDPTGNKTYDDAPQVLHLGDRRSHGAHFLFQLLAPSVPEAREEKEPWPQLNGVR